MATTDARGAVACELLIRNAQVVTMDANRRVLWPGAVAVDNTRISQVGLDGDLTRTLQPRRTIDAKGALVHPGFVDAHYHATMHLTRGALPDSSGELKPDDARAAFGGFVDWFNALDGDDEFASAQLACLEMIRNGVTCFMEPGTAFEPAAVASAVEKIGIRASVADPFLWDVEGGLTMASQIKRAPPSRQRALNQLGSELRRNHVDALVRGHVALYGSGSASLELELAAKACADEGDVVFTQHQSLDASDAAFDRQRFGADPLVHLHTAGVLGTNTAFMHMNVLTPDERSAVEASGMTVIWHPGNFLYYGIAATGPSPVIELHAKDVPIALGTDLAKAWTFAETGWLGYLVARLGGGHFSPAMILEASTLAGAQAMRMQGVIGSIEIGKKADIVIRRDDVPEAHPSIDRIHQLALISRTKSVDTVIVDGQVVVEDGHAVTVDEEAVYRNADASARRVLAKVA